MGFGKPIGHPNFPVMTVFGEAVRLFADALGDASPRRGPVLNRKSATHRGCLSNARTTGRGRLAEVGHWRGGGALVAATRTSVPAARR